MGNFPPLAHQVGNSTSFVTIRQPRGRAEYSQLKSISNSVALVRYICSPGSSDADESEARSTRAHARTRTCAHIRKDAVAHTSADAARSGGEQDRMGPHASGGRRQSYECGGMSAWISPKHVPPARLKHAPPSRLPNTSPSTFPHVPPARDAPTRPLPPQALERMRSAQVEY